MGLFILNQVFVHQRLQLCQCKENDIPIIFFSFDTNTSKVGIETRIEAFVDMLKMQKERL